MDEYPSKAGQPKIEESLEACYSTAMERLLGSMKDPRTSKEQHMSALVGFAGLAIAEAGLRGPHPEVREEYSWLDIARQRLAGFMDDPTINVHEEELLKSSIIFKASAKHAEKLHRVISGKIVEEGGDYSPKDFATAIMTGQTALNGEVLG